MLPDSQYNCRPVGCCPAAINTTANPRLPQPGSLPSAAAPDRVRLCPPALRMLSSSAGQCRQPFCECLAIPPCARFRLRSTSTPRSTLPFWTTRKDSNHQPHHKLLPKQGGTPAAAWACESEVPVGESSPLSRGVSMTT